jgi:hypothetical protein
LKSPNILLTADGQAKIADVVSTAWPPALPAALPTPYFACFRPSMVPKQFAVIVTVLRLFIYLLNEADSGAVNVLVANHNRL